MQKLKGFTLVELLIVMAIIAFLTVMTFAGLAFGLRQARDTQRRQMVTNFNTAVQAYYSDRQFYPPASSCASTADAAATAGLVRCNPADYVTEGNPPPLRPYLDGDWNWGPIDPDQPEETMGYYTLAESASARPLEYAVCTLIENTTSGTGLTSPVANTGCFCMGTQATAASCNGLTAVR